MASDFLDNAESFGDLRQLRLDAKTMGPDGITRSASISLGKFDQNEIVVSGGSEVWVSGLMNAIMSELTPNQSRLSTWVRNHWGNVNTLLLILLLVWLPGVDQIIDRLYISVVTISAMLLLMYLSTQLIPIAIVRVTSKKWAQVDRLLPDLAAAILAGSVIALVELLLSDVNASAIFDWVANGLSQFAPVDNLSVPDLPDNPTN